MVLVSVCVYWFGVNILEVCKLVVWVYLNLVLLLVVFGYGEVYGLGDGLWVWFVVDLECVN